MHGSVILQVIEPLRVWRPESPRLVAAGSLAANDLGRERYGQCRRPISRRTPLRDREINTRPTADTRNPRSFTRPDDPPPGGLHEQRAASAKGVKYKITLTGEVVQERPHNRWMKLRRIAKEIVSEALDVTKRLQSLCPGRH